MSRPQRAAGETLRRIQRPVRRPKDGPLLPGEFRPLAPVPAASDSGDGPVFTEAQLLSMLIRHYRWVWLGTDKLMRYNPHGRAIRAEVEALEGE